MTIRFTTLIQTINLQVLLLNVLLHLDDLFLFLTAEFNLEVLVSDDSISCYDRGLCLQH